MSHVPGGLGVFETALVVLCKPALSGADLLPVLVVYRAVYYLLPFVLALAGLAADELWQRRRAAARVGSLFGAAARAITPRLLAVLVFLAGALLLFSGATPAAPAASPGSTDSCLSSSSRSRTSRGAWPGCAPPALQGISRRLDVGYYLTVAALGAGIGALVPQGRRLRGGGASGNAAPGALGGAGGSSIGGRPSSPRASRPAGLRRCCAWSPRRSSWACSPSSTSSTRPSCGGSSQLGAEASRFLRASVGAGVGRPGLRPRPAAAPARRTRCAMPARGRPGGRAEGDRRPGRHPPEPGVPGRQRTALDRGAHGLRDVCRAGAHVGGPRATPWAHPEAAGGLVRAFLERAPGLRRHARLLPGQRPSASTSTRTSASTLREARGGGASSTSTASGLEGRESKGFRNTLRRLERSGHAFRVVAA